MSQAEMQWVAFAGWQMWSPFLVLSEHSVAWALTDYKAMTCICRGLLRWAFANVCQHNGAQLKSMAQVATQVKKAIVATHPEVFSAEAVLEVANKHSSGCFNLDKLNESLKAEEVAEALASLGPDADDGDEQVATPRNNVKSALFRRFTMDDTFMFNLYEISEELDFCKRLEMAAVRKTSGHGLGSCTRH